MSFLKAIFGGGGSSSESSGTGRMCVIDGERMIEGREAGPGDRFQVLQRLAKFHEREKIKMQVVFGGRPLREAEHGADFNGIKVLYTEQGSNYVEAFLAFAKEAGRGDKVMVITNDIELEKRAIDQLGVVTLRASTLRKALEGEGDRGSDRGGEGRGEGGFRGGERGGDRGGRGRGGRDRGGRGPRRGPPGGGDRQQGGGQGGDEQSSGGGDGGSRQQGGGQGVSNLIDLVE